MLKRTFALALVAFATIAPFALAGCTEETKPATKPAPSNPNEGGKAEAPKT